MYVLALLKNKINSHCSALKNKGLLRMATTWPRNVSCKELHTLLSSMHDLVIHHGIHNVRFGCGDDKKCPLTGRHTGTRCILESWPSLYWPQSRHMAFLPVCK